MFKFLKSSYSKVKSAFSKKIRELLKGKIDEDTLDELEKIFYEADLGVKKSGELIEVLRHHLIENPKIEQKELIEIIRKELVADLSKYSNELEKGEPNKPTVVLVVGVNGSGKTTSVAKLAKRYQEEGKKVLIAAADTFRAAAIEQLTLWSEKLGIEIVKSLPNSDPSSVVFDAVSAAVARGMDVVIIDTAGRLHVKTDLMQELQKIRRVCAKVLPGSPHETLLVLDATIGQNAIDQAKTFHKFTPISGIILTKLDGTPKGGIVLAIQKELGIPVKLIGIGEAAEDLQPFVPESFVSALLD